MAISKMKINHDKTTKPLRFITCGNVDDGKSTLIGRLLWDTQSVKSDHAANIEATPVKLANGETHPDFANLLDGLQAEREQGITIDVAYRYFSTVERSFIVADTPGHEQYTRNMVTGASNADLAILLIDAQSGVTEQTRRHAFIASTMGIRQVVFAINKMDLVGYSRERFDEIGTQIDDICKWMQFKNISIIPVAAVHGYNVVVKEDTHLNWYSGLTLLECLKNAESEMVAEVGFHMCVQRISRPDEGFRGYQGTVRGNNAYVGQTVIIQPSQLTAKIEKIVTFDGEIDAAINGDAVTLVLDRKIDISRGDFIADAIQPLVDSKSVEAKVMVLDDAGINPNKRYWLKTQSRKYKVFLNPKRKINLRSGDWVEGSDTQVNSILEAELTFDEVFLFHSYETNRHAGSFILIDSETYNTVAGGTIAGNFLAQKSDNFSHDWVDIRLPTDLAQEILLSQTVKERLSEIEIAAGSDTGLDAKFLEMLKDRGVRYSEANITK